MNTDEMIRTALTSIVPTVVPLKYDGKESEYIVFNYDSYFFYAEGTAQEKRDLVQVHYFLPYKINPNTKKTSIAEALNSTGFTYPSIVNASDEDGQHYVFECEICGDVDG